MVSFFLRQLDQKISIKHLNMHALIKLKHTGDKQAAKSAANLPGSCNGFSKKIRTDAVVIDWLAHAGKTKTSIR